MEVSYTLTDADLRAYLEWGTTQPAVASVLQRSRLMGTGVFVAIALIVGLAGALGGGQLLFPIAGVVMVAAAIAFLTFPQRMRASYVNRSMAALASGKTAYVLGPRTARISAEGFALSAPDFSASYAWCVFERIEWSASGVYFFVGAQQAHLVPRSAFASAEELQRFAETAQSLFSAAMAA